MASKLHSIPDAAGRTRYALGCLSVAVTERIRKRRTLAWIGRAMIAFSVFGVSLGGMALTQRFDSHQARDMIFVLCLFYSLAGVLALTSLRGLRAFAGAGIGPRARAMNPVIANDKTAERVSLAARAHRSYHYNALCR